MKWIALILALGMAVMAVVAQTPAGQKPSFEVASVKASSGNRPGQIGRPPGGRLTATNVPLAFLIQNAYRVRPFQLIGGPAWMTTDLWDVEAKAQDGSTPAQAGPPDPNVPDALSIRLQALLEDRFKLQLHRETRELPIFELTAAKGGLKARMSNDQGPILPPQPGTPPPSRGGPMPRGSISMMIGGGELHAAAVPFANLIAALSQILGRTVIDKTDAKGLYDFDLKWTPDVGQAVGPPGALPPGVPPPPVDPSGPSLVTALQEQLGLKLESAKGPVDVLVIDSVQKPTEN
jgi:bla regulator protein blaR1